MNEKDKWRYDMGDHILSPKNKAYLSKIYLDPKTGFGGIQKLYNVAKEDGFTLSQVKAFLAGLKVNQIRKQSPIT